jgi:hypothetical protein
MGALRIRRIDDNTWHELAESCLLPDGYLREAAEYELFFELPGQDHNLAIEVSDGVIAPLELKSTSDASTGRWRWLIEHYAGIVELCIRDNGNVIITVDLDVAPHPFKLGKTLHAELLTEVQQMSEGLSFGLTAGHSSLEQGSGAVPLAAQYCLFNALMPLVSTSFARIIERPHRRLQGVRQDVPLHQIRRCDAQTVVRAARSPAARAALAGQGRAASEVRLNIPRMEHTFDTALNRYVRYLTDCLIASALNLADRLESHKADDEETRSRTCSWAAKLKETRHSLRSRIWSSFLEEIPPRPADASAIVAAARHPDYARFIKLAQLILHPAGTLGKKDDSRMTLRPTYEIYEYWSFLKLASILQKVFPDLKWSSPWEINQESLLFAIPDGSSFVGSGNDIEVTFTFQKNYRYTPKRAPSPYSISTKFRPDFVLEMRRGSNHRRFIFDAKYRSSAFSIKEAFRDMHVYRDAIRIAPERPAFDAVYILVPHFMKGMSRFFNDDYRKHYNFGGFLLKPGGECDSDLENAIRSILNIPESTSTLVPHAPLQPTIGPAPLNPNK